MSDIIPNTQSTLSPWWGIPDVKNDIGCRHYYLYEFDDGRLLFACGNEPMYTAPVLKNDAGQYYIDREKIHWLDEEPTAEDATRIIDEDGTDENLRYLVDNLHPSDYIK